MLNIKKTFKIFYYFILACLVLVALLLTVSVFPVTGNFKVKMVESGSMEPSIKTGALVVIKPAEDYKVGDVITFNGFDKEKGSVTHRIVDMEIIEGKKSFITKGDANNASDKRGVPKNRIIGKVLFDIPYLGYIVDAVQKPIGFMLIIVIPATIIIYDEFRKIGREVNRIRKNKNKDKQQDEKIEHLEEEINELKDKNK